MKSLASFLLTLAIASWMLVASPLLASQLVETSDFADVEKHVAQYEQLLGSEDVLLVCDIDNTLLAMNHALGSDQWFEWQSYLLASQPGSKQLVAKDFGGLLNVQGTLFTLGSMRTPEPSQPAIIAGIQARGVRTLVLTSRGPDFRLATRRELLSNGYEFSKSALPLKKVPRGNFLPYNLKQIKKSGLTRKEITLLGLGTPRPVSYADGVYMTAGQHKGAMLLTMLAKCEHKFRAIVFVDDHNRHIARVYDAITRRGIDVTCIHYQREDANVNRFNYSNKRDVSERWQRLDKTLQAVFD